MRKTIVSILLLWVASCCLPYLSLAQTKTVTGVVTSAPKTPIPGVTVLVKGTTRATSTNENGKFSIIAEPGQTLEFSSIGFESKSVRLGKETVLEVVLTEGQGKQEEEVVVTTEFGMKRIGRAVGSSVQVVDGSTLAESGRESFISALAGRVPGLNVTSTSGLPGASNTVVLRNLTSISGNNQPLYVIDGVPMNNSTYDPISMAGGETYSVRNQDYSSRGNDVNPEDIESITVLKGAAAAALYGSDASNGAIIITTKKGRAGRGRVSYNNFFKWDKAYGWPDIQTKYANGSYGTTNYYNTAKFGGLYPDSMKKYDNIAAILQTGTQQRHNLSVEAGTDKATIRGGVSYLGQKGVIKMTDYDRFNLSLSGQAKITEWLKFDAAIQYTRTENNKALRGTDGPLYRAMIWPMVDDINNYQTPDGFMRKPDYYLDLDLLNPLFAMVSISAT